MNKIIVEIRAAEGGEDAKLLVDEQANIYRKWCGRQNLCCKIKDSRSGQLTLQIEGKNATKAFSEETGGHRWQRVPPTERRGRVHTSTITVAVFSDIKEENINLDANDVIETRYSGSGAGGQHRNKHMNCVRLQHVPTDVVVTVEGKHYHRNRDQAWKDLKEKLQEQQRHDFYSQRAVNRKEQVGSGMRGDKRRTYRERDNRVVDHVTGKRATLGQIRQGQLDLLR